MLTVAIIFYSSSDWSRLFLFHCDAPKGKYVETIGGSVNDVGSVEGGGVGQARFAFLILLFVVVVKFRDQGLMELPSIAGFFTYQLASLSQGKKM
jgi:hypothetical protein